MRSDAVLKWASSYTTAGSAVSALVGDGADHDLHAALFAEARPDPAHAVYAIADAQPGSWSCRAKLNGATLWKVSVSVG